MCAELCGNAPGLCGAAPATLLTTEPTVVLCWDKESKPRVPPEAAWLFPHWETHRRTGHKPGPLCSEDTHLGSAAGGDPSTGSLPSLQATSTADFGQTSGGSRVPATRSRKRRIVPAPPGRLHNGQPT